MMGGMAWSREIAAYTLANRGHSASVNTLALYAKALELLQMCDSATFAQAIPDAPTSLRKSLKKTKNVVRPTVGYAAALYDSL